jgi:ribonuclease D
MGSGRGKAKRVSVSAGVAMSPQVVVPTWPRRIPTTWFLTPPRLDDDEETRRRRYQEFRSRHIDYALVDSDEALGDMLATLNSLPEEPIALDFETASRGYRWRRQLSRHGYVRLIQIGWVNPKTGFAQQWIVDCQKADPRLLRDLFQGREREKIVHWSKFEHDFAQARLGFGIENVFDTAFAWQSIQKRFRLWLAEDERSGGSEGRAKVEAICPGWEKCSASMVALADRALSLELPKELQMSNWNGELEEEQLVYAATDVAVPIPLATEMRAFSKKAGVDRKVAWRCKITREEARKHASVLQDELDESRELTWRFVYAENLKELERAGNIARQGIMPQAARQELRDCYVQRREELLASYSS